MDRQLILWRFSVIVVIMNEENPHPLRPYQEELIEGLGSQIGDETSPDPERQIDLPRHLGKTGVGGDTEPANISQLTDSGILSPTATPDYPQQPQE